MIKKESPRTEKLHVFLVLSLALAIRLFHLDYSITADELSALERLQFSSFKDLLYSGIAPDGHPALVQTFLFYYTKIFGSNTFVLRFPFAIAGVIGLYYVYKLGNITTGHYPSLFAIICIGFSQLFIVYSRLARPYAFGFMFCAIAAFAFIKIIQKTKYSNKWNLTLAVASVAAMYTHFMAFFFVGIILFSFLFFLNKNTFKSAVAVVFIIALLYLPYINIFFYQMGHKGVGGPNGWLGVPDTDTLKNYFYFLANESEIVLVLLMIFVAISFFSKIRDKVCITYHLLFIFWFASPLLFAYYYSKIVNPIFQNSILIFSSSFLFLLSGSILKDVKLNFKKIIPFIVIIFLGYDLIFAGNFYKRAYFGLYKELAENAAKANKTYGQQNIAHFINVDSKFFSNYSNSRLPDKVKYELEQNIERNNLKLAEEYIEKSAQNCNYLSYSWSNVGLNWEIIFIIKKYFPYVIERKVYFNSEYYLFSKKSKQDVWKPQKVFNSNVKKLESPFSGSSLVLNEDSTSQILDDKYLYGYTFSLPIKNIFATKNDVVCVSIDYFPDEEIFSEANLVMEIKRKDSLIDWQGMPLNNCNIKAGKFNKIFLCGFYKKNYEENDVMNVYFWNNGGKKGMIKNLSIENYDGNKFLYAGRAAFEN